MRRLRRSRTTDPSGVQPTHRQPDGLRRRGRRALSVLTLTGVAAGVVGIRAPLAEASSVTSATFTGGAGTVVVGSTLYAKAGGSLTLTVATSSDTKCVDVAGAFTGHQQSQNSRSSWTFSFTAVPGDGAQPVTAIASPGFNSQDKCTGNSGSAQTSFVLDNSGPLVTAAPSPAPNGAGWNNANVGLTWSATDAGSGVASGPSPSSSSVNADTAGVVRTANATDRLGNTGTGSVTVKLDKAAPSIAAVRSPAANSAGWNNSDVTVSLTCSDGLSGVKSCTGGGTVTVTSEGANQSVTATVRDNADNTQTGGLSGINIDKTAPSLSGAPITTAANGWYRGDVAVAWQAADALSGLAAAVPSDSTITGEGLGIKASASISDRAGNTTYADSAPVNIDRTAPTTGIAGPVDGWINGSVAVHLSATDNLSGVASTSYAVDGGPAQTGTGFTLSDEGDHTVTFFSTDQAGNAEAPKTARVRIDKTAPTIRHSFTPAGYVDGAWTNGDVTVVFECADAGGSGVATCTAPTTISTEGHGQLVDGMVSDGAGNSAKDVAVVSVDKTAPSITAQADRAANGHGWYDAKVMVSFTCADVLSGIAACPDTAVLGQGANQSVTGQARDAAGNSSAPAGLSGINVDTTPPTLTAQFPEGWQRDDVTVRWTCADDLSGLAVAPAETTVVTGEGGNLSTSATCEDRAGNVTHETVDGIKIDRTAPTTASNVPAPLPTGWYPGAVDVELRAHDALSGVAATFYRVDGGAPQTYDGPFSFGAKGEHVITFWSTDVAGNAEDHAAGAITLRIDGTAPTTSVINPISPASGWFVESGIPVAFHAVDAESGIDATYYSIDGGEVRTYGEQFTAELATGTHTIVFWSVDLAGNAEARQTTTVRVDTIPPTVQGAATPSTNGFGWNNTDVEVTFTCDDGDSGLAGVAGCAGDETLTNEGADQTVRGSAVDIAGNTSSVDVGPINIDKTKPTLGGAPATLPNAAGWYRDDVSITWTGADALSGLDPASEPQPSVITGEGSDLAAGPVTVADKAGNVSDPAAVNGIDIDRTAPTVAGAPTTGPNDTGWYHDTVTVRFACSDSLSGVAVCPQDKTLHSDGAAQQILSGPALDLAGNTAPGVTVGGINIDGTAPKTTSDNQCTKVNGWCTGSGANVVLSASDQAGLSGVREIHYQVNAGPEQVAAGNDTTVTVPLDGSGDATIAYYAIDRAGNVEAPNSTSLKWDNIAPTVGHSLSVAPNAEGWNNSDVTVHFSATDDDAGSGVDPASVTADVHVVSETAGQVVNGSATDTAGNVGTDSVTVKVDKTNPVISGAALTAPNASGWYAGPVTIRFTCGDDLAGVAICPGDVVLTDNGAGQSVIGTATDQAGNTATAWVGGINIDAGQPVVSVGGVSNAGIYTLGAVPGASCTAGDDGSGLAAPCRITVSGGLSSGVGTFTFRAEVTDRAGNTAVLTGSYRVVFRFDRYAQPVNDTAHQAGASTSIFKGGSTIPAKLQLKRADGTIVQAASLPVWLAPVQGSRTSAPVDESAYTESPTSGGSYRWDAAGQQYIYNWSTKGVAVGYYHRMGVTLEDGQTYTVNIGLR